MSVSIYAKTKIYLAMDWLSREAKGGKHSCLRSLLQQGLWRESQWHETEVKYIRPVETDRKKNI